MTCDAKGTCQCDAKEHDMRQESHVTQKQKQKYYCFFSCFIGFSLVDLSSEQLERDAERATQQIACPHSTQEPRVGED
jgi:hypothetical protein